MYSNCEENFQSETGSIHYLAGKCETLEGINFGDLCVAMPIQVFVEEYSNSSSGAFSSGDERVVR